jgi:rhodanese-related sulfurtransferase
MPITQMNTISPQELSKLLGSGMPMDVIDVRQPGEYRAGHVPGATLIPLGQISAQAVQAARKATNGDPVYVICQSGGRSRTACERLSRDGMPNVVNVEGGTSAWRRAGLPVEVDAGGGGGLPGWARVSGFLALIASVILGLTLQPVFLFVAPVIWIAMIFAGGGTCPLAACGTQCKRS